MKTKKSTPLSIFLTVLLAIVITANADVKEQCKTITAGDVPPGPNYYHFCVTSLQVVPGSSTADTTSLAVVTAGLSIANATTNMLKITALAKTETNHKVKAALLDCKETYSSAADNARSALYSVKKKVYDDANIVVSAAMSDVDSCKDGFKGFGLESPIAKETNDLYSLLAVLIRFVVELNKQQV